MKRLSKKYVNNFLITIELNMNTSLLEHECTPDEIDNANIQYYTDKDKTFFVLFKRVENRDNGKFKEVHVVFNDDNTVQYYYLNEDFTKHLINESTQEHCENLRKYFYRKLNILSEDIKNDLQPVNPVDKMINQFGRY